MIFSSRSSGSFRDYRPRHPAVLVLADLRHVRLAGDVCVENRAVLRPRLDVERAAVSARTRDRAARGEDARAHDGVGAFLFAQRENERPWLPASKIVVTPAVEKRVQR